MERFTHDEDKTRSTSLTLVSISGTSIGIHPVFSLHQGLKDRVVLCQPTHFAKVHRPKIGREIWNYHLPNLAGGEERECVHKKLLEVCQVFNLNLDAVLIGQQLDGTLHYILVL